MKNFKVSEYLHYLPVAEGIFIGWNRFLPSFFIINNGALSFLDRIKQQIPFEINPNIAGFLEEAEKHNFLYTDEIDPSPSYFSSLIDSKLIDLKNRFTDFYCEEKAYNALNIETDRCNLACPYCISEASITDERRCRSKIVSPLEKQKIIEDCIDQFFDQKIKNNIFQAQVAFNGGEILVEWPLVKRIIEYIASKFPGIQVEYIMNTNMTLITEEIAQFLNLHKIKMVISIDGYREAHDSTRIYHNKKGSFDDVMNNVELYRKFNTQQLEGFQGTFDNPDEFDPEEVYKMDRYGFRYARLAPDLLHGSEEDAHKKAQIMKEFLENDSNEKFQVSELVFTRLKNKINKDKYEMDFNCNGLYPKNGFNIGINISTLHVSQLCGFIKKVSLPIEELDYNIFSPKLTDSSLNFIKERMDKVQNECLNCPIVGMCLGGCIMAGLNSNNDVNKTACTYLKEMSDIYIKNIYLNKKKKKIENTTDSTC